MEAQKATPTQIKNYFSTPDHPVTNSELINYRKNDPEGYDELARELHAVLSSEG